MVLLQDSSKELAMLLAENLRKRIEKHDFLIESELAAKQAGRNKVAAYSK